MPYRGVHPIACTQMYLNVGYRAGIATLRRPLCPNCMYLLTSHFYVYISQGQVVTYTYTQVYHGEEPMPPQLHVLAACSRMFFILAVAC